MAAASSRYAALDHIRGLSILGILIVNAIAFAQPFDVYVDPNRSPVPMSAADGLTYWAIETFAREKFITLFSLLFGISVHLVAQSGDDVVRRRLIWLVVFGLIHGALIWHGDILLLYAVTGLVFTQWHDRPARWLCLTGLGIYAIGVVALIAVTLAVLVMPTGLELEAVDPGFIDQMRSGFWGSLGGNAAQWAEDIPAALIIFGPMTLGLMMLGLGLFKAGFFKGEAPEVWYLIAIAAGLVALLITAWLHQGFVAAGFKAGDAVVVFHIVDIALPLLISLAYASVLILIGRSRWGWCLYPLSCVGRMAFTNYLTQSLIMTALFYGGRWPQGIAIGPYEPPLFGTLNHASLIPIVVTVWIGQIMFSLLWLQLFRYGPFEWVWRCLTHKRWVAILKP